MAYATLDDLVARFGQAEMIRLTATTEVMPSVPDAARAAVALEDASAVIDSHISGRYATPLAPVPRAVVRACCILARHDLAQGGDKTPTDEMRAERDQVMAWLRDVAADRAELDATPARAEARTQDRPRLLTAGLP